MSLVFAPSRLRLVRGTTWSDALQLTDDNGDPVSLVGVDDVVLRVRKSIASTAVLIELSVTNNRITIADAALGKMLIAVDAIDTLVLPINGNRKAKYVYDAVIDRGGSPDVIEPGFRGKLTVFPQITRLLPEP